MPRNRNAIATVLRLRSFFVPQNRADSAPHENRAYTAVHSAGNSEPRDTALLPARPIRSVLLRFRNRPLSA